VNYELMYTSLPKGLQPGSMGYCTVALTPNCPNVIREKLENLSSYRHVFSPFDAQAHQNPVCLQHVIIQVSGKTFSVLSSITDAGLDYSNRTNKFAHHLAIPLNECPAGNPAWALQQPRLLERKWAGEPRQLTASRQPLIGGTTPTIAQAWKRKTGDAGWAGMLAEAFLKQPTVPQYVIFDLGDQLLQLFQEAIAILPKDKQWQVTFSTFYLGLSADVQCLWRGVLRDSPEAQQAKARKQSIIDLAIPGTAPGTPWTNFARTGEPVKSEATKTASPSSTRYTSASLPRTFPFVDDDEVPTIRAPAKTKPKDSARAQPAMRPMSNITFDEKRLMAEKDELSQEKPTRSKLPYFIAGGIFALLLVFGLVLTLVISMSDKPVQAQVTQVKQPVATASLIDEKEKKEPHKPAQKNGDVEEKKERNGAKENTQEPKIKQGTQPKEKPDPTPDVLKPGDTGNNPTGNLKVAQPPSVKSPSEDAKADKNKMEMTRETGSIPPLTPLNKTPLANVPSLIPVKYHQLPLKLTKVDSGWLLVDKADQYKTIRLLGKDVFTDAPYRHPLQASTYEITHTPGSLQFKLVEPTGGTIDIAEVVVQKECLILRSLGPEELNPTNVDEIINILYKHPLLCEMKQGVQMLQCFYPSNHRIDPPPATLELTLSKISATPKADDETVSLQSTYQLLSHIQARLQCFGTEAKGKCFDLTMQVGDLETMDVKTEAGQTVKVTKPQRRLVKLSHIFRLEKTHQELSFKAILHFEGEIPTEPSKPRNMEKHVEFEKNMEIHIKKIDSLIRETNKNSPHSITLKDLNVIARFAVGDKKLEFLLWQLTP
jgi:hypothetical protein